MNSQYLLFVAGEASGDRLGASLVSLANKQGFRVMGAGGEGMCQAGLEPLVPFSDLPVSGFLDVLPRIFRLRRHYFCLVQALRSPDCRALVCIDYPGFNLRLTRVAKKLGKPVYWLAPPQIWAWKPKRGRLFVGDEVAVFFGFEEEAYRNSGAHPVRVRHPLSEILPSGSAECRDIWAIFPGSRLPQAMRNAKALMELGRVLCAREAHTACVFVMPDVETQQHFARAWPGLDVRTAQGMLPLWPRVRGCVCPPGTASLELALRGIPLVVFTRVDILTRLLGGLLLSLPFLALPNLLLGKGWILEHVAIAFPGSPSKGSIAALANHLREISWEIAVAEASALRRELNGVRLEANFEQFLQGLDG